jgi:hypothetical protein
VIHPPLLAAEKVRGHLRNTSIVKHAQVGALHAAVPEFPARQFSDRNRLAS